MALCMHDLKLQLEVSKLASGKIVLQVTNFLNDSILHSRIFTITLTAVIPNTNGKIFKDKSPGSPELGQVWFLHFTVAAIQSQVLTGHSRWELWSLRLQPKHLQVKGELEEESLDIWTSVERLL